MPTLRGQGLGLRFCLCVGKQSGVNPEQGPFTGVCDPISGLSLAAKRQFTAGQLKPRGCDSNACGPNRPLANKIDS